MFLASFISLQSYKALLFVYEAEPLYKGFPGKAWEPGGKLERKFEAPVRMFLKKSQVPAFLDEFGDDLLEGPILWIQGQKDYTAYGLNLLYFSSFNQ